MSPSETPSFLPQQGAEAVQQRVASAQQSAREHGGEEPRSQQILQFRRLRAVRRRDRLRGHGLLGRAQLRQQQRDPEPKQAGRGQQPDEQTVAIGLHDPPGQDRDRDITDRAPDADGAIGDADARGHRTVAASTTGIMSSKGAVVSVQTMAIAQKE